MKSILIKNKIVITILLFMIFYITFIIFSDFDDVIQNFKTINVFNLIPIIGILTFSMFLRSILQGLLLKTIGIQLTKKQNFSLFLSGYSMLLTPGGTGQMIKSHFIAQKYGFPITKSLPLVFAERLYDLFSIIIILIFTLLFFYTFEH